MYEIVKKYEISDSRIENAFIEYMENEYEYILLERLEGNNVHELITDRIKLFTERAKEIVEEIYNYVNLELGKIENDLGNIIFDSVKFKDIYNIKNHIYYTISIDFTDNKDQEVMFAGHFTF